MQSSFDYFLQQIQINTDTDYGDFMRKVNHYLNKLIKNKSIDLKKYELVDRDHKISNKLNEMQTYIQFNPSWDISAAKEKIIKDIEELTKLERKL